MVFADARATIKRQIKRKVKRLTDEPKTVQEMLEMLSDRMEDPDSIIGFVGQQLERIADSLEKIEKRGRPDDGYGIF